MFACVSHTLLKSLDAAMQNTNRFITRLDQPIEIADVALDLGALAVQTVLDGMMNAPVFPRPAKGADGIELIDHFERLASCFLHVLAVLLKLMEELVDALLVALVFADLLENRDRPLRCPSNVLNFL